MKLLNKCLLTLVCATTIFSCQSGSVISSLKQKIWPAQAQLTPQVELNSQLMAAAEIGDLQAVEQALTAGANIHTYNNMPLRRASSNGHVVVVCYLVEQGANIHVNDDDPLRLAATNGQLAVVQYLVEHGANIHALDNYALWIAAKNGHWPVVAYLLRQGANRAALPEPQFDLLNKYICSELEAAFRHEDWDRIEELLSTIPVHVLPLSTQLRVALWKDDWHKVEELLSTIPVHELPHDIQQKIKDLLVPAVQEKFISARLVLFARTELTNPQLAFKTLSCIVGPRTYAVVGYFVKKDTHEITQ